MQRVVFVKRSELRYGLKLVAGTFICVLASGLALFGCAKSRNSEGNQFQIPWPDESGAYHLQNVSIPSFSDPNRLQGENVRIFVNPRLSEGRLASDEPIGRFVRTKSGVGVPSDYMSLQATAIHAHYERLAKIDASTGADIDWPVKVGIRASVRDERGTVTTNAIFDGKLDALLIVPYSGDSLPIALNGGILAHEHFHMIFQRAVVAKLDQQGAIRKSLRLSGLSREFGCEVASHIHQDSQKGTAAREPIAGDDSGPIKPKDSKSASAVFNSFYLRALNEGLADYWAWVYTGDANFIVHSLPSEAKYRRLDLSVQQLLGNDVLKRFVFRGEESDPFSDYELAGNAYLVGSQFARVLRELTLAGGLEQMATLDARLQGAKALIESLSSIAQEFVTAEKNREFVSSNVLTRALYARWPGAREGGSCQVFQRVSPQESVTGENIFPNSIRCPKDASNGSRPVPTPTVMQSERLSK